MTYGQLKKELASAKARIKELEKALEEKNKPTWVKDDLEALKKGLGPQKDIEIYRRGVDEMNKPLNLPWTFPKL